MDANTLLIVLFIGLLGLGFLVWQNTRTQQVLIDEIRRSREAEEQRTDVLRDQTELLQRMLTRVEVLDAKVSNPNG